jgi:hypothetical protein
MNEVPNSRRKMLQPGKATPRDIFARLAQRGIDYSRVKQIVQLDRPQYVQVFGQWFKGHTIKKVLAQLDQWKTLLKNDFILSLSKDLKDQVERSVICTESIVWVALLEAIPQVGPWDLHIVPLPSGNDQNGQPIYIHARLEIRAVHHETKETRRAQIPGGLVSHLSSQGDDFRRAFETLGLWHLLQKGDSIRRSISKRSPQGWPICTRLIIPQLYEFMLPHYPASSHLWLRHRVRPQSARSKPLAQFPKELLTDMLEILRLEDPHLFGKTTPHQLKSAVQRHLARKPRA